MSLEAGFGNLKTPSLFRVSACDRSCKLSASCLQIHIYLAATLPCHYGLLFLWILEPKYTLPFRNRLSHGVSSQQQKGNQCTVHVSEAKVLRSIIKESWLCQPWERGNSPCLCPSASWSRIRRLDDVTHIVRGETSLLYELTQILISLLENSCQTQLRMSFDQQSHNPSCSSNWCIKCTRVVFLNYSSLSILVSH